jgi:hypothetical protein
MKFADVIASLMAGKRVRKTNWESKTAFFLFDNEDNTFVFHEVLDGKECRIQIYTQLMLSPKDLISDFWEIIE